LQKIILYLMNYNPLEIKKFEKKLLQETK